jgi:hypothetical protein
MTPVNTENSSFNLNINTRQEPKHLTEQKESGVALVSQQEQELALTDDGRLLLAVLTEIDESSKGDVDLTDKVESFTYGAFGMEHPDDVKEVADSSYSAGQYLKGALSIGAMLLAIV